MDKTSAQGRVEFDSFVLKSCKPRCVRHLQERNTLYAGIGILTHCAGVCVFPSTRLQLNMLDSDLGLSIGWIDFP